MLFPAFLGGGVLLGLVGDPSSYLWLSPSASFLWLMYGCMRACLGYVLSATFLVEVLVVLVPCGLGLLSSNVSRVCAVCVWVWWGPLLMTFLAVSCSVAAPGVAPSVPCSVGGGGLLLCPSALQTSAHTLVGAVPSADVLLWFSLACGLGSVHVWA